MPQDSPTSISGTSKVTAYFERILRGKKERRKIALVATAHYLLRYMHAILVRCEP